MVKKTDKDIPHILNTRWDLEELKDQLISSVSDVIKKYNNGEFEPTNINLKNLEDLEKEGIITKKELEQLIKNKCFFSKEESQIQEDEVEIDENEEKIDKDKEIYLEEAGDKVKKEIEIREEKINNKVKVIKDVEIDQPEVEKIDEKVEEVVSEVKKKNRKFLGFFDIKRKSKVKKETIEQETVLKLDIEDEEDEREDLVEDFDERLNKLGENIEGFKDLSDGQRSLVLENFKQLFLANIKEDAQKEFQKDLGNSKFLGKILKGILKSYEIARLEKEGSKESFKLESETHQQIMEKLVQGMKAYGPEVKLDEEGKIEIQYAGEWQNLNEDEQKIVDNFNEIATKYSHISYEWSLDTATKKQAKQFEAIKNEYEEAREEIMNLKKDKSQRRLEEEKEEGSLLYINKIDGQIQMNQFLFTHLLHTSNRE